MKKPFQIGAYRPIYLWAGPGTIRMNKVKFMGYPVDEAIHREAHTYPAAKLVVEKLYSNWVHLIYNWGFPPEIEQEDWEDFRKAATAYHEAGSPVFAYIQTSNCVYSGSFVDKDWYARSAHGKKVYYYAGRYMIDWMHPEWIEHLKFLIQGAIDRGADGIFFDNLWYGEEPNSLMGAWLGGAGCYCQRCQDLYQKETGYPIPKKILPEQDTVADYLRWRAARVTSMMRDLEDFIHQLKPGTPISANDYDVTMRNSFLISGIDVEALADIQDVIMVENFALPSWQEGSRPRLANNALTIRNTREFVGDKAHLNVLSYDVGIGFDPVYPPRRHQQGMAEAAACGASMTIKGTEYNDGKQMTLLTDPVYQPQHDAIGDYQRWLEKHQNIFQGRKNLAPLGLWHPGDDLWRYWMELASVYHGVGQMLTRAGIPWRVVRQPDDTEGVSVLLTFSPSTHISADFYPGITRIHVPDLPGWAWRKQSLAAKGGFFHDLVESAGLALLHAYHGSKPARWVMDQLNMAKLVTQTNLFNLPKRDAALSLLQALPDGIYPRVEAQQPVLIETWQKGEQIQVHLVNYAAQKQEVQLIFDDPVRAKVISPETGSPMELEGRNLRFPVDIYSILLIY